MSQLTIINGSLNECEIQINEMETEGWVVSVVNARSVIEESSQLGSGTGFRPPKVKYWQMLLQYRSV